METNANSNLIELNVVHKATELQNNKKMQGLGEEDRKTHAYMTLAWQISALIVGGILMKEGISLSGVYALSIGVITGIGHTLCVLTKIHPSRLFMGFLFAVGLAGLFLAFGIFLLF